MSFPKTQSTNPKKKTTNEQEIIKQIAIFLKNVLRK